MISDHFDNITGIHTVLVGVNNASNGMFTIFLVLGLFFITFISLKRYETITAFIVAAFTTSLLSGIFWGAGLINLEYVIVPITLLVGGVVYKFIKRGG